MGIRATALVAIALASAAPSSSALAQPAPAPAPAPAAFATPAIGPPRVTWLHLTQGDASGSAGSAAGDPSAVLFEPLRLDLMGSHVPSGGPDAGCAASPAQAGNATASSPGFAPQRTFATRFVPHLTLVAFSRGGCAIDAGGAVGLVYTVPLRPNLSLVLGAGAALWPNAGPGGTPVRKTGIRADLVFHEPDGRSLSVGVRRNGVSFGGIF